MFVTKKMALLDILILQKDIENVSQLIVKAGCFEPSEFSSISSDKEKRWIHENITDKKKIISSLKKDVQELEFFFASFGFASLPVNKEQTTYLIPTMGDTLRQYLSKKKQLEDRHLRIKKQKEETAVKIAGLQMHMSAQTKKHQEKANQDQVYFSTLGLISTPNLSILKQEFHRYQGELLTEGHVNESEIVFISIPEQHREDLMELLSQLYFINYGLPEEFFGEGISNMMRLSLEYTLICDQEDMLESEIKKFSPIVLSTLQDISTSLDLYSKISEVHYAMKQAGHFVLVSGWIATEKYRQFRKDLQEVCGTNYEITVTDTDTFDVAVDVPTRLENPKIFKPFEQLVLTFGTPNYKEIDPTMIFGALYVVMYGAMFGDVGQGLMLFLLGVYGTIFKKNSSFAMIFGLMVWVGMSSIFFGFMYGSYFGYESAYYSWVPDPVWFSPMHNIETILAYAIIFGVFVISFSYILGIINALRMKDTSRLIFSHKGLTAFIVYILVLTMAYMSFQQIPIPTVMTLVLVALSIFLGLERVWDAVLYGHGSVKDWWMGFFDMFEFFLSMLTNTLSFVRIGAFALTHAALMMAVFTLRDLAGGDTFQAHLIVVFGNLFVVGMEGFIVGIQTLRLQYYEFFMRFFLGTGRVFKPISFKS